CLTTSSTIQYSSTIFFMGSSSLFASRSYPISLLTSFEFHNSTYLINKNIAFFDNIISSEFTSLNKVDEALCKFYNLKLGFHAAQLEILLKRWSSCLHEFYELSKKLEQK
ncbi:MAG: hypothetical protein ACOYT8_02030, partial [Candidatus Dependentiae bacterium]